MQRVRCKEGEGGRSEDIPRFRDSAEVVAGVLKAGFIQVQGRSSSMSIKLTHISFSYGGYADVVLV